MAKDKRGLSPRERLTIAGFGIVVVSSIASFSIHPLLPVVAMVIAGAVFVGLQLAGSKA